MCTVPRMRHAALLQRLSAWCVWPCLAAAQVVLCVGSMYWTRETADAIGRGTLHEYADTCTDELMKVVNKVMDCSSQCCWGRCSIPQ